MSKSLQIAFCLVVLSLTTLPLPLFAESESPLFQSCEGASPSGAFVRLKSQSSTEIGVESGRYESPSSREILWKVAGKLNVASVSIEEGITNLIGTITLVRSPDSIQNFQLSMRLGQKSESTYGSRSQNSSLQIGEGMASQLLNLDCN